MNNFIDWLNMGGYAGYVWGAYAIWAIGFVWLIGGTFLGQSKARREIQSQQRRAAIKTQQNSEEQA